MLKAVRLDDKLHADIISFIENFKDDKGKQNESAALRYLIVQGYKSINPEFAPLEKEIININKLKKELLQELNSQTPNIDDLKTQIREELIKEMNYQKDQNMMIILEKLNKLEKFETEKRPIYSQPILNEGQQQTQNINQQTSKQVQYEQNNVSSIKEETKQIIEKVDNKMSKSKVSIQMDTNPLLANILGNANR